MHVSGYAAIFNVPDAQGDTILHGAFSKTLADREGPLPLYWQHRPDQRIGWLQSAIEDERGLCVTATIDKPAGRAAQMITDKAVTGLSFGYRARKASHCERGRTLEAVDLFEVSVVTHPLHDEARLFEQDQPHD